MKLFDQNPLVIKVWLSSLEFIIREADQQKEGDESF
jgi:hypothetical protein